MPTPYATLKTAIQALKKADTKLTDTLVLASDRTTTMRDIRTMFHYQHEVSQAVIALEPVLARMRRLSAPPVGEALSERAEAVDEANALLEEYQEEMGDA